MPGGIWKGYTDICQLMAYDGFILYSKMCKIMNNNFLKPLNQYYNEMLQSIEKSVFIS